MAEGKFAWFMCWHFAVNTSGGHFYAIIGGDREGSRQTSGSPAFIISDSFIITAIGYDRPAECVTATGKEEEGKEKGDKHEDE